MSAIAVQGLTKTYGDLTAVDDVDLVGVQLQASSFFERLTAREQIHTFAALWYGARARPRRCYHSGSWRRSPWW